MLELYLSVASFILYTIFFAFIGFCELYKMRKQKEKAKFKIKITHIHPMDAYHADQKFYLGLTGEFEPVPPNQYEEYYAGYFLPDVISGDFTSETGRAYFCGIKYKRI